MVTMQLNYLFVVMNERVSAHWDLAETVMARPPWASHLVVAVQISASVKRLGVGVGVRFAVSVI